ncbi:BAG family molecular chaperone regulator 7 [Nicotiana tabacum]|uniref:BAG family molecular chaperone regulator 7 n=1 Tax=Nicotiana tabacum TaxID=4097 RepID=A0A1S4DEU7_TOBAC|nr:PREDICTED: BAG family molecular chaperone regulator 7-like [Nicotiana tabacum]
MSRFRRFDLIEYSPSPSPSFFLKESSFLSPKTLLLNPSFHIEDELDSTLDLLCPNTFTPTTLLELTSPFDDFDTITDLIQIERTPFYTFTRRVHRRVGLGTELQSLSDRVSELERLFIEEKKKKKSKKVGERKYTWAAEIKSPEKDGVDRKYKWIAEVKDGKKKGDLDKSYKFTAEIKGKNEDSRTYTFKASNAGGDDSEIEKKEKKDKKKKCESGKSVGSARLVEIEEPSDHGALVLRQVFAKRVEKRRGKRKEISPQDAALAIQMSFRAYLIRRSQALRALRELAIAKTKLKELRALFNNFTYRRRVTRDAEERQRFSEKIIVLLLTVDAIEGADVMVRSAKKTMVDELEAMLDVIDPQPGGRPISVARRRTFDMPDGAIQKELAAGVAQVVQMLDESNAAESFEACL